MCNHPSGRLMYAPVPTIHCSRVSGANVLRVQVDNRIRYGLRLGLELRIITPGATIIAVQGWKGGLGHTNTIRILTVPTDVSDLDMIPLGSTTTA